MEGIYTDKGLGAKSELWTKHGHLVRQEALRLHRRLPANVSLDDLIQAGAIGFLGALESFDPKKGIPLTGWITQRIKWALLDELRESDWVPRRVRTEYREIVSMIQQVEQEKGGGATEAEIAEKIGVPLNKFQQILSENNSSQLYSIDELQEMYADGWECINDENGQLNPVNDAIRENLYDALEKHTGMLPERERLILHLYYQQDLNMKEIGLVTGFTQARISQLHSLAIKRLRARIDSAKM